MAEARDKATFDIGVEEQSFLGNIKDAELFLSGKEVTASPDDLEERSDEEEDQSKEKEKDPKKVDQTKQSVKEKIDPNKLVDSFLSDDETKEEEDDEDQEKENNKDTLNKEKNKKEESSSTKSEESEELNYYSIFSEELYKVGSFTTEDGEEPKLATTPEEFIELFNEEKRKGATQWLDNFLSKNGEDKKDLFEAIFINGVDPKKYLPIYNEIIDYESFDLTKEEDQESIVRAYYSKFGWEASEVNDKIEKLKQYADLEEEAKKVHPKLIAQGQKELERQKLEASEKEQQIKNEELSYRKSIEKVLIEKIKTKDFDGIPIDQEKATKVFNFLSEKKWKLPSGELLTDFDKFILETKQSENISKRVKMALLAINDFDLSKIKRGAISKESSSLFSKLTQRDAKKSNIAKKEATSSDNWDNI